VITRESYPEIRIQREPFLPIIPQLHYCNYAACVILSISSFVRQNLSIQ
jgi:hypothetical protein